MELENKITFYYGKLEPSSFYFFNDMKKDGDFCDVIFQVGDQSISAHRLIVAAAIPYFREILSNKTPERKSEVSIPEVDPSVLEALIDFAYTSKVEINIGNVRSLLTGATHLLMHEVMIACCNFIADRLRPETVFEVHDFARNLNCSKLIEDTECYMQENFSSMCQLEAFLNSPPCLIKQLTSKGDLLVESEEEVFEAIMKWIKKFPEERKMYLPELLSNVRLPLLDLLYLQKRVAQDELISVSIPCRNLLDEVRDYHLFPDLRNEFRSFSAECRSPIKDSHVREVSTSTHMYKLCAEMVFSMHCFEPVAKRWTKVCEDSFLINDGSVAGCSNKIYFLQGSETVVYDSKLNSFEFCKNYASPRNFCGAASVNRMLYLCGGTDGTLSSNEVECFDEVTEEWAKVSCMHERRKHPGVVALGKYVYVTGGSDESCVHDSVEKYNTETRKWRKLSPMNVKRSGHGSAVLDGKIYVCGGNTLIPIHTKYTSTAEVYDPLKNSWKCISSMHTARFCFALLAYCGKLYALGGIDAEGTDFDTIEVYDPETDQWEFGQKVDLNYSISGAAVISSKDKIEE